MCKSEEAATAGDQGCALWYTFPARDARNDIDNIKDVLL